KDKFSLRSEIEKYLALKAREVRPRSLIEMTRYLLTGPYFKPLHGMPVDKLSRKDVASRLATLIHEHGNIVAGKARDTLSGFFVHALQMGITESTPVVGTRRPPGPKPRERVLSDSELAAIWHACGDDHYGKIIKLIILTGARRQEVGGMAWSELDLERGAWTLPAERSKNGRKHELPLLPMAAEIIKTVPRMVNREQLFGQRAEAGFVDWGKGKIALDRRCGVAAWRPHDLRRTIATRMSDLGIAAPHVIETLLNHVSGFRAGVAGTYNRSSYQREVRNALALWEDHVNALVTGD